MSKKHKKHRKQQKAPPDGLASFMAATPNKDAKPLTIEDITGAMERIWKELDGPRMPLSQVYESPWFDWSYPSYSYRVVSSNSTNSTAPWGFQGVATQYTEPLTEDDAAQAVAEWERMLQEFNDQ